MRKRQKLCGYKTTNSGGVAERSTPGDAQWRKTNSVELALQKMRSPWHTSMNDMHTGTELNTEKCQKTHEAKDRISYLLFSFLIIAAEDELCSDILRIDK